jgi:hypothetical protein
MVWLAVCFACTFLLKLILSRDYLGLPFDYDFLMNVLIEIKKPNFRFVHWILHANTWGDNFGFFRPIHYSLFYLEYWLWGSHVIPYRLVSLGLEWLSQILVFLCVRNYLSMSVRDAFLVSLVWYFNYNHGENIIVTDARNDVLATFFGLLSLVYLSPTLASGALLARESGIIFFPILLILAFRSESTRTKKTVIVTSMAAQLILYGLARLWVFHGGLGGYPHIPFSLTTVTNLIVFSFGLPAYDWSLLGVTLCSLLGIVFAPLRTGIMAVLALCSLAPYLSVRDCHRYVYFASLFPAVILVDIAAGLFRRYSGTVIVAMLIPQLIFLTLVFGPNVKQLQQIGSVVDELTTSLSPLNSTSGLRVLYVISGEKLSFETQKPYLIELMLQLSLKQEQVHFDFINESEKETITRPGVVICGYEKGALFSRQNPLFPHGIGSYAATKPGGVDAKVEKKP